MTEKDIIFKSTKYPELTALKTINPQKYQERSQQIVDKRLQELLPIYRHWHENRISMPMYEVSLRSIESLLDSLDYTLYDGSIEGKRQLTLKFYSTCMCYPVDEIIQAANKRSVDECKKIKNLINRSAALLYKERNQAIQTLKRVIGFTAKEAEEFPLLSFIPFGNSSVGVEWIQMGDMQTVDEIVDDWIALLCLNKEMFSSDEFIRNWMNQMGEKSVMHVQRVLLKRIPINKAVGSVLSILRKKNDAKTIDSSDKGQQKSKVCPEIERIKPKLSGYTLVEKVHFNQFIFGNGYMIYKGFIYKNEALTSLVVPVSLEHKVYIDVFLQNTPKVTQRTKSNRRKGRGFEQFLDMRLVCKEDLNRITDEITRIRNAMNVKTDNGMIIAKNVPANEFEIHPGYILYKKMYIRKSVKIKEEISRTILSQINKTFCLRKEYSKNTERRNQIPFVFDPADDLSFLLAECDRLKDTKPIISSVSFPLSGEFELPWKYVTFYDNLMYLRHPNSSKQGWMHPFVFRHPTIALAFRDIMTYIEGRCPKFYVRAVDGEIVALLNFQSFQSMIPQFREYVSEVHQGIEELEYNRLRNEYSSSDFSSQKFIKKSRYLSHLASIQVHSRKIYRILERVLHAQADTDHDEFGFLITVKEYIRYSWIIYENVSDESRSSILFQVSTDDFDDAIQAIRKFFASPETNKRQRLSQSTIHFKSSAILSYRRIHHTNFHDWKSNLSSILYL